MLRVCAESELQLVNVLTKGFGPFQVRMGGRKRINQELTGVCFRLQGAPDDVWRGIKGDREELEDEIGNALEVGHRFLVEKMVSSIA